MHFAQDRARFSGRKYHRYFHRPLRPLNIFDPGQFFFQDLFIKKEKSTEGLVLRGRGDISFRSKMTQKFSHLIRAQAFRVPLSVKNDESFDPVDVSLLRPHGIMPDPYRGADTIQQFHLARLRGRR